MLKSFFSSIISFLRSISQRATIAVMATVVSTCALCVSLYEAQLSRRQQLDN